MVEKGTRRFGYHPVADYVTPQVALEESVAAEGAGFDSLFFPDHFHPWSVAPGTPFAWTLIASAAERTKSVQVGTAVTCPMLRYNPAIVAQAFATLGSVYEGRIFLGVGTGEVLNEVPVGCAWPAGKERLERLAESVQVIHALWEKEGHVSFRGKYYTLKGAKLFTRARTPIPIYISALGPKAAELAGRLGDGWITLSLAERDFQIMVAAFERGLRESGRDPSKAERIVELAVSYDEDFEKAVGGARVIAGVLFPAVSKYNVIDPREIESYGRLLDSKVVAERLFAIDDIEKLIARYEALFKQGFTWVELASFSPDNTKFMELARTKVLPYLKEEYGAGR